MKLMIAGSRSIQTFDLSSHISQDVDCIISGGAEGIDRIAEQYADDHRLSKIILRPQYGLYKRNAPLIRNRQMVDLADAALIVWDGVSKGTRHTIEYAQKKGIPLQVIHAKD